MFWMLAAGVVWIGVARGLVARYGSTPRPAVRDASGLQAACAAIAAYSQTLQAACAAAGHAIEAAAADIAAAVRVSTGKDRS